MPKKQKKKLVKQLDRLRTVAGRYGWLAAAVLLVAAAAPLLYWYLPVRAADLPEPALYELAATKGVRLGVTADPENLSDERFTGVLTSQYTMLTAGGQIHWDKFRPAQGEYYFKDMDRLVEYAGRKGMAVQAQHLVWDEEDSLPKWLKEGNYSHDQLMGFMHDHIATTVGRYKGRVHEWTVVNEAHTRQQHIWGTEPWWGEQLGGGTEYIDKAFLWARQADPDARLILNDFYNETETAVSNAQYEYLKSAKARGIPIDGVGIQMHIDASRPPSRAEMVRNMQRFRALGYPVYVTEFDVNASTVKGDADYKAQLEARITADVVRACVESASCASFTVFGMTDKAGLERRFTRGGERSHLLSHQFQPRPSFYAFRDAWLLP